MRWDLIAAVLVVAAGLGLSWRWSEAGGGAVPAAEQAMVYSEQDDSRTVTMARGTRFAIELESNPSTGFNWDIAEPLPETLALTSQGSSGGNSGSQVGAPGAQRFDFVANASGTGKIVLGYRRVWEKGVEPAKTFRLGVVIE